MLAVFRPLACRKKISKMKLDNKVALVTGGTMGIGAAIAIDLARSGADIAIAARHANDEAQQVQQTIQQNGRRCVLLKRDMGIAADCRACVEETVEQLGRLDVLVHNAGGPAGGTIDNVTADQWQQAIDVHVTANFHLAQAALPHLRKNSEAAIVTVSSVAGLRGVPGAIAYCTVKGAVAQFTRALALELADDNIRVNSVAPGIIRTRFHKDMPAERKQFNLDHRVPLHREGTPEQVAEVVTLLVTNDYITGEVYTIDGGLTMRIA